MFFPANLFTSTEKSKPNTQKELMLTVTQLQGRNWSNCAC